MWVSWSKINTWKKKNRKGKGGKREEKEKSQKLLTFKQPSLCLCLYEVQILSGVKSTKLTRFIEGDSMGAFQDLSSYRRNIKQFLLCSLHSDWHKIISKCKILFSWFLILQICDCDPPTLAHHLCEVWPSIFPFFSSSHLFFVCLFVESTTAFSFFYSVVLRLGILHSLLFLSAWNSKQWSWTFLPSPFPQIHPASGFSGTSVSFYISKYSHFATCGTPVFAHF